LYVIDVDRRVSRPVARDTDLYYSLAIADRRLVASVVNPKSTLWKVPVAGGGPSTSATPIRLPTGRLFSPRLGPGYLLYVSPRNHGHGIWKVVDGVAAEMWSAADARVVGGPHISPDGRRVVFSTERQGKTRLEVVNADGTGARVVSDGLALQGSPAWAPDGASITTGASVDGRTHLVRVSLDGTVQSFVAQSAVEPTWSPDGQMVVYSGADVGTQFTLAAATASGSPHPLPAVTLTRGARRVRFAGPGRLLVVMRGDIRHKDLWCIDLDTGAERRLTSFPSDFVIRDFDVSPDGRELVVERLQEPSDIVLIDLEPM
jgi:Tol biopolymer transport system component